jgi:hypothetical protein
MPPFKFRYSVDIVHIGPHGIPHHPKKNEMSEYLTPRFHGDSPNLMRNAGDVRLNEKMIIE